ncbi:MAG: response regulator transcription factor [Clostridia bacterium]|nr:response regulator transcription factor [Clostridia bacterium]
MFPVLTGVLSFAGIISLVFYKRASKQGIIYSYIFVLSIPFIVLDLIFADKSQYLLTCIPYIAFTVAVFIDVFSGSERLSTGINEKEDSLAGKYDLTERELEVYQLASKGLSNQEISEQLFVSVHTVKTHLQHIFTKLNINTKYQLINFSKENEKDED